MDITGILLSQVETLEFRETLRLFDKDVFSQLCTGLKSPCSGLNFKTSGVAAATLTTGGEGGGKGPTLLSSQELILSNKELSLCPIGQSAGAEELLQRLLAAIKIEITNYAINSQQRNSR